MLHKFILQCNQNSEHRVNYHWGSVMHGILHENIPTELSAILHEDGLRPYAQYILPTYETGELDWHISTWNDAVAKAIENNFQKGFECKIKAKEAQLRVKNIQHEAITEEAWALPYFTTEEPEDVYTIRFLTPCTHKTEGRYATFPATDFIINGLYRRFSSFSKVINLDDVEVMRTLCSNTEIAGYQLQDAIFYMEKTRIKGYTGTVTLKTYGNAQLRRLTGMLINFAEYAGIGVKTSIGMGGCAISKGYRSRIKG